MEEQKLIDAAISSIEGQIRDHRVASTKILICGFVFATLIFVAGYFLYAFQEHKSKDMLYELRNLIEKSSVVQENEKSQRIDINPILNSIATSQTSSQPDISVLYIFSALFLVVFGVLMALYRFHLSEISRAQQYRIGLLRIRIAANNFDKEGFGSEVRQALTQRAFQYSTGKEKKVESPLPGHPGSDIATLLINKLMDKIDIQAKSKDKDA